ncbi:hypothetical protein QN277_008662 [Acacia crassicarpa]|uniref:Secreted protein n=1 Tax=Acacia crassicarpa TaxID=499986 RepID=A0AAE1M6W2_9FABA|nr:hypothetical protein QN277_008662 [Acacia crassicarpa]
MAILPSLLLLPNLLLFFSRFSFATDTLTQFESLLLMAKPWFLKMKSLNWVSSAQVVPQTAMLESGTTKSLAELLFGLPTETTHQKQLWPVELKHSGRSCTSQP